VYVDNKYIGKTPLTDYTIELGKYVLEIRKERGVREVYQNNQNQKKN